MQENNLKYYKEQILEENKDDDIGGSAVNTLDARVSSSIPDRTNLGN